MSAQSTIRTSRRDPNRISVAGTIVEMAIIGAAVILFNFYPEHIGFWRSADDPTSFTPLLGPGFAAFLPWLNTYWLWAFWLCVANLALQHWTLATRVVDLALNLLRRRDLRRHVHGFPLPGGTGRDVRSEIGAVGCVLRLPAGRL